MSKPKYDIGERAVNFVVRCAKLIGKLPRSIATIEYGKQLIRSSASVGANIEEADGTLTKRDFMNKMALSRREARESKYWLNLINKTSLTDNQEMKNEMNSLLQEAHELMLILSSIVNKVRNMA